jgi:hypothetical protein
MGGVVMLKKIINFSVAILVMGCASVNQPGLSERDLYVVNTPDYPDNRVFYLGPLNENAYSSDLVNRFDIGEAGNTQDPVHGDPLSIIVNSVSIPIDANKEKDFNFFSKKRRGSVRDIVVVLDVLAENQGASKPIVVWYQRGVLPGQSLNFSNLLVFHQESWDDRVPPLFRIRVIDVANEKNLEAREVLSDIANYGNTVALALQNPALSPVISTATRAASLVLSNKENKMLLDYSVQFYKSSFASASSSFMTPLKTGSFILIGRKESLLSDDEFWKKKFIYDHLNGNVYSDTSGTRENMNSPVVVVSVNKEDMIVPPFVAAKSAYLTSLLTDSTTKNLDQIKKESEEVNERISVYVLRERVRRYRTVPDLDEFIKRITDVENELPSDVVDSSLRFLRRLTECNTLDKNNLYEHWELSAQNVAFVQDDFKVRNFQCPEHFKLVKDESEKEGESPSEEDDSGDGGS